MQGFDALWMPGTDHAGIATQNVVERMLAAEGTDRHALGRDAFIQRVWQWKADSGGQIINQLKRLGASCDWSRERFTLDEGLSRAVREVFVRLYEEGLIYKGDYIINWCPRCRTALADLEVEHDPHDGHLYYIRYPLADGGGHLTVATTRPETLLGDTAVAVNPEDKRYQKFHGATLRLPVLGREIPVITDSYVSLEFGTGALKITPAHDFNDFEVARRHNLPAIQVIDEGGQMSKEAGPKYVGMDRFVCREQIVKDLKKQGLLEKVEPYQVPVGHCYRCKVIVEPLISKQWFVAVKTLAAAAIAAVQDGRTKLIPANWDKSYFDWMTNIRDWCISRQIWWGHRIPAWTCKACGQVIVSREDPAQCPCGGELVQETDVLDTWFSSALWPFSTLGWPDQTPELKIFYPTSVLVTAFDILFFWVARMMMMGIHFMGEVPFREVYIHALVRDPEGQKMSKSKGNVIDPLDLMDQYGTDAFRFSLAAFAAMGRDVRLNEERIAGYRNFANKVWNASRFTLMNLEDYSGTGFQPVDDQPLTTVEAWITSRLQQVAQEVAVRLDAYEFDLAANALYQFTWHEFCDWYLELIKPQLYDKDNPAGPPPLPGRPAPHPGRHPQAAAPLHALHHRRDLAETARRAGLHHGGAVPRSRRRLSQSRRRGGAAPGDGHHHRHPQPPGRNERAPRRPGGRLPAERRSPGLGGPGPPRPIPHPAGQGEGTHLQRSLRPARRRGQGRGGRRGNLSAPGRPHRLLGRRKAPHQGDR